jgi:hypothetical protein
MSQQRTMGKLVLGMNKKEERSAWETPSGPGLFVVRKTSG